MQMKDDFPQLDLDRLVRVARGLEAGGFYNAAKLLWALSYSQQVRSSSRLGVPTDRDELNGEIEAVIQELTTQAIEPALLAALRRGQQAAEANRAIPASDIPPVYVCRSCGLIILADSPTAAAPDQCPGCGAWELTFREFPPVYYLEPLHPQVVLQALETAPQQVDHLIQGLSEDQMLRSPKAGEWGIREALFHLLAAEELLAGRVERMLSEDNPSLEGVAAWTAEGQADLTAAAIQQRYRLSRQATLDRLRHMPVESWWRTAWHEEFGSVTILQQASYFAKHERAHLPQLTAIRKIIEK